MKKKSTLVLCALLAICLPAMAVLSGVDLSATLKNLRQELQRDYHQISRTREKLTGKYEKQHQKMVEIIKDCNDLSLMLYSQKQDYTFDLSFALIRVTEEYNDFNRDRTPYDHIVNTLDREINRYARLIESLRRLPPELKDLEVVPDSLAYHNDSLDLHLLQNESLLQQAIDEKLIVMATAQEEDGEEVVPPFILDQVGQEDRDSCLFYASELLKMYAATKETVMADSTHYKEAYLRLKESHDYAREYYKILEHNVFVEGQTPWFTILSNAGDYWRQAVEANGEKYDLDYLKKIAKDNSSARDDVRNDSRFNYSITLFNVLMALLVFLALWGLSALVLLPVFHFVKPVKNLVDKRLRPYLVLLATCLLFLLFFSDTTPDDMVERVGRLASTFVWLLAAILTALLIRLKPHQIRSGFRPYQPTIVTALIVIGCRVLFLPNALINFFLPPVLLGLVIWQFTVCLIGRRKTARPDAVIGWISLCVTIAAMLSSWAGYIFLALIILIWWYFQLAAILTIVTIWHLLSWYKERRLDKKIDEYRKRITYVSGPDKEKLLFAASWFYDLVRGVVIPVVALMSIPLCLHMALDVFDFDDLFYSIFKDPFVQLADKTGAETFCLSLFSLLSLVGLYFLFRYLNKAIHTIWQYFRFQAFLRKYKREHIQNNEINLSLGNSIISVLVWFTYIVIVIITLKVPTDSLGLIAGGLSAGIGLALKDIINNFIYGIQLMGGRLRVGDWIECDGVRGKVTDINYQSTLVETTNGTQVAFLNASLFGKNFTNLTRNNAYELTKITVGVNYGVDVRRVREILEKAMEVLKTKDAYGRDVIDPAQGIHVSFEDFGDSAVTVAVKQYVLVAERIAYVAKAKEVVYNALNDAGITIPFPQCDVHLIKEGD
ncbi:MAG: mechanosensitive ion channel [Bacteroidales bacterium]|nr:mechanosensitive ion channel [Bacteroidales bacterium]